MPISSSYRQKEKTVRLSWNSTKSRRLSASSTQPATDAQDFEKELIDKSSHQFKTRPRLIPSKTSLGSRPARTAGTNSLSKPLDNRSHPRTLSSRRPLRRRETTPEFYQSTIDQANKEFKRSNSDSLIKPCDSKRKVRRELGSRRIRTSFPKRFAERKASGTQIKTKKLKVDSEAKLLLNNKNVCFSDYHQTPEEVGQRVICIINKQLRSGVTKFIGTTHFSEGVWCGIVLDEPCGKNDGSVKGVRYFSCGENYGIFVHVHKVRAVCENDLGIPPRSAADVVHSWESPDTTLSNVKNAQNELNMSVNNAATDGIQLRQWNEHYNDGYISKIRSRSFSDDMIPEQNKSELSTNNMQNQHIETGLSRSNSLPKILTKKDILKSGNHAEQLTNNSGDHQKDGCTELCNENDFVFHENGEPIVSDNLSSKETDPCCDNSNRQNLKYMTTLQDRSDVEPEETKNSKCGNVMSNSTEYKNTYANVVPKQLNSVPDKRSHSYEYISVDNNKPTKDSTTPGLHAALEGNETIDPFVQGKYCSCPSLVPSQHLSSALESCIDLGRQELESHSEKCSPIEEVKYLEASQFVDSGSENTLNDSHTEQENLIERFSSRGRSLSLPLVLVPIRHISQTESLFWSLDKLSESVKKNERAESWPTLSTLSTSLCNLDLRPVVNDTSVGSSAVESDNRKEQKILANEPEDDDKNLKKMTRSSAMDQLCFDEKACKNSSGCPSLSGSQASLTSSGTCENQKLTQRKISSSSVSSSNSQSRKVKPKSQRNCNSDVQKGKKDLNGKKNSSQKPPATLRLVKRHTVSGLQKLQQPCTASDNRPSVTRRPTSTISVSSADSSPMGSPSYAKSRLPTMRKKPPTTSTTKKSTSTDSKPKGPLTRQPKGLQKDNKKPASIATEKKTTGAVGKKLSSRKASTSNPTAQKTGKKVEVEVMRRGKPTTQPGVAAAGPGDKKSGTSTKTTVVSSPKPQTKPLRLQAKGSPPGKPAVSPSKHYASRLPRKIISRDTSTDSGHSHEYECDVETASIGTDGSDFLDGQKLSRGESFSHDHDQYDADRSDLESSTKSWQYPSHAPDILTGTREIHTRSAGVQVQMSDDGASQEMYNKLVHVEEMFHLKSKQCQDLEAVIANGNTDILASAMLFIILCKKLQNNGRLIMQLKNHLHSAETELKQVQDRLAEEEENGVKLQEEMMYVRSEHTVAIQNLKADHEDRVEALRYTMKKQLAEEQKKAADERVAELLELSKVHEEKVAEIKKQHEKTIADLDEKYKDEIVEVESKHSQHIDELLEEHQVEIETIKNDYEEQHGGIESKLFAVTNECTSLNMKLQRLQEETERDIESRIQEAIEKYKSLPAELESIRAVLDMKNDEIKLLKKGQMESKLELDHLRKVAERARKLELENESLSFVVENKSKFERQLSVEHEQLKNSLDRESKKLKRLSLENEELQWRLCNSSTSDGGISPDGESPPISAKRRSFRLSSSSPDVDTINE